ncbi:MAG: hypothetical protein ACYS8K_05365 [Planctomycetota bacterium]|jgi:hypothetical protein
MTVQRWRQWLNSDSARRGLSAVGWALFALLALGALAHSGFLTGPLYGDEAHFFPSTVELVPFRIARLEAFSELSSPTFFIAFSYVLQVLGRRIFWCRLVVFLCLVGCAFAYRRTAAQVARRAGSLPAAAPLTWILLLTFPYVVGCGVYYYSDVPGLLFALLAYGACARGRTLRGVLWATLALHCRQYFVFIPVGAGAAEAWSYLRTRDGAALRRGALWLVPILSFVPYLLLWGGPSPMRHLDPRLAELPAIMPWHVTYLLAACGLYLLPIAAATSLGTWHWPKAAWCGAALALFCLFPPRPNLYFELIDAPITTLGFLDVALRTGLGPTLELIVLGAGATLAAALHYELLVRAWRRSAGAFPWMIAAFWAMNLFSHLTWEKYLLPLLPLLYLGALRHPALSSVAERRPVREQEPALEPV